MSGSRAANCIARSLTTGTRTTNHGPHSSTPPISRFLTFSSSPRTEAKRPHGLLAGRPKGEPAPRIKEPSVPCAPSRPMTRARESHSAHAAKHPCDSLQIRSPRKELACRTLVTPDPGANSPSLGVCVFSSCQTCRRPRERTKKAGRRTARVCRPAREEILLLQFILHKRLAATRANQQAACSNAPPTVRTAVSSSRIQVLQWGQ